MQGPDLQCAWTHHAIKVPPGDQVQEECYELENMALAVLVGWVDALLGSSHANPSVVYLSKGYVVVEADGGR